MSNDAQSGLADLVAKLKPSGPETVPVRPDFLPDESRWFAAALDAGLIQFQTCGPGCSRLGRSGEAGPDEFLTPSGERRHLYSAPGTPNLRLNREYVPHIAAYAYVVLHARYNPQRSYFSRYRTFSRDLISKRSGEGYETDAEFYDADGRLALHVEVKTWPKEVNRIAAQLDQTAELQRLPDASAKELEYVLDLAPRYIWIVGPGTIDPPAHVFQVSVYDMNARFERLEKLPAPFDNES